MPASLLALVTAARKLASFCCQVPVTVMVVAVGHGARSDAGGEFDGGDVGGVRPWGRSWSVLVHAWGRSCRLLSMAGLLASKA